MSPLLRLRTFIAVACVFVMLVALQAQERRSSPVFTVITTAAKAERVGVMASYQNGVAPTRNGSLFALVRRSTYVDATRTGKPKFALELWRSDNGTSWRLAAVPPVGSSLTGSITPDGDHLAMIWSATNGDDWRDVFFQRYDPSGEKWVGAPTALAVGSGPNDHYTPGTLARTASGALLAVIGNHRTPQQPVWRRGWSAGMRWLPPGRDLWSDLEQVNVAGYGLAGNAAVRGDAVDIAFFSKSDRSAHSLRTFDTGKAQFVQSKNLPASAKPTDGRTVANVGLLCADATGGRTLIHLLGHSAPGKGRLCISYSRPGTPPTTVRLADDPPLRSGNVTPRHFTLARGPGNQVFAYFSKAHEDYANLWQCVVEEGRLLFAPKPVLRGIPQQFANLNGMRDMQAVTGLHLVLSGPTKDHPNGAVCAFGGLLSRVAWDRSR